MITEANVKRVFKMVVETPRHFLTDRGAYNAERETFKQGTGNKLRQCWDIKKIGEDRGMRTILGLKYKDKNP